jgi:heat shock protein HslJ
LGKDIFIQFDKIKTRVTGHAGCNVINGGYSFDGINLKIGPIATSKMMCESTQMQIESEFTKALSLSDNVFIVGDKLQLRNGRSVLAELEGM